MLYQHSDSAWTCSAAWFPALVNNIQTHSLWGLSKRTRLRETARPLRAYTPSFHDAQQKTSSCQIWLPTYFEPTLPDHFRSMWWFDALQKRLDLCNLHPRDRKLIFIDTNDFYIFVRIVFMESPHLTSRTFECILNDLFISTLKHDR